MFCLQPPRCWELLHSARVKQAEVLPIPEKVIGVWLAERVSLENVSDRYGKLGGFCS